MASEGTLRGIAPGTLLGRRYRVEHVLSAGANPALVAIRHPDGARVLIKLVRHSLLERRGALVVHLFRDAKVVSALARPDLVRILEFDIDPATQERLLVMELDTTRTAAQLADPNGREERTALALLQVARALIERHDYDAVHATPEAAVAPEGAVVPAPTAAPPPPPEETWVHVRAEEVRVRADDPAAAPPRSMIVPLLALSVSVFVTAFLVFREDRAVEPPPPQYPWYHNYSTGAPTELSDDPNDPYAHDPDVRRMRALRIVLTSSPLGAAVWDGFRRVGVTPMPLVRPQRGDTLELRLSKPGFEDQSVTVEWDSPKRIEVSLDGMMNEMQATEALIRELKRGKKTEEEKPLGPTTPGGTVRTPVPTPILGDPLKPKKDPYDDD